jgi:chorismate mutase
MRRLRLQVDRIDLKMLQLLQQRTKLSGQIGRMKRRHGAVIYVPEREHELVSRLVRLSKGKPSARVVAALYREILSSSRSAQGQAPIGLLRASAPIVLPASRACFGACDEFSPKNNWAELVKGLDSGALSLALLTGSELMAALRTPRWRSEFSKRFAVAGDFPPISDATAPPAQRIFIVTPRGNRAAARVDQMLVLIVCNSTANAIKSLLHSMSDFPIHAEQLTCRGPALTLARLTLAQPVDASSATSSLLAAGKSAGIPLSILGTYQGARTYAG